MYYEELRDGVWERIDVGGGDAHWTLRTTSLFRDAGALAPVSAVGESAAWTRSLHGS